MKEEMIKQYYRDKNGVPVGVLVAVKPEGKNYVTFGWSLCHEHDSFNKKKGTMIAENRALTGKSLNLPETLRHPMERFELRAFKYFFADLDFTQNSVGMTLN